MHSYLYSYTHDIYTDIHIPIQISNTPIQISNVTQIPIIYTRCQYIYNRGVNGYLKQVDGYLDGYLQCRWISRWIPKNVDGYLGGYQTRSMDISVDTNKCRRISRWIPTNSMDISVDIFFWYPFVCGITWISILLGRYLIECMMGILGIWMDIWMCILEIRMDIWMGILCI